MTAYTIPPPSPHAVDGENTIPTETVCLKRFSDLTWEPLRVSYRSICFQLIEHLHKSLFILIINVAMSLVISRSSYGRRSDCGWVMGVLPWAGFLHWYMRLQLSSSSSSNIRAGFLFCIWPTSWSLLANHKTSNVKTVNCWVVLRFWWMKTQGVFIRMIKLGSVLGTTQN